MALLEGAFLRPDGNRVYWFSQVSRAENLLLRAAPINVGWLLRDRVYSERRSTVFTSATLAVGGTFDYFRSRVGLGPEVEEMILASPFDFYHQAIVCLPTDMPAPEDESFDAAVEEIVAAVARTVGGRTLALFTSHRQLRDVHAALKQRVDLDEVLILGQGIDGQRRQLLKTFQEAKRPLLLGTASFWEGIDIPGERLSCVIVVRLPFPVPTEPVYAARAEQVRDPFSQLAALAPVVRRQGRNEEAEEIYLRALDVQQPDGPEIKVITMRNLAYLYWCTGRPEKAKETCTNLPGCDDGFLDFLAGVMKPYVEPEIQA